MVYKSYKRFITSKWWTGLWLKGEGNESDCNKCFCHHVSSCVNCQSTKSWLLLAYTLSPSACESIVGGIELVNLPIQGNLYFNRHLSSKKPKKAEFNEHYPLQYNNDNNIISYITLFVSYKSCLKKIMLHLNLSDNTHYTKIIIVDLIIFLWKITTWAHFINFYNYPRCMKNTMMLKSLMMMKTKANTIIQNGFFNDTSLLLHIQANNKQTTFIINE